jgi:O-acetyl-ADP-ribose deacetylase (regulator of RNase III)
MKKMINYIEGDLFDYVPNSDDEVVVICHVCNNIKAWGAGFVIPLAKKYPEARQAYLEMPTQNLGEVGFVFTEDEKVVVANMIGQEGVGPKFEDNRLIPPIRYEALKKCMEQVLRIVNVLKEQKKVSIACPLFGSGLAGGSWDVISKMIEEIWHDNNVTVYYLPQFLPEGWTPPK